ncbi:MAG TPA: ZIP family metal transporter [Burkholderiaceae bacterium]|nr:ZIP family metal transporter [Burkholderiaceae bacterium]
MNAALLSLITFFSTAAGGLCALGFRDRLHLILGFTAGVLLGVVAFDLLPESFDLSRQLGGDGRSTMIALAAGFLLFHAIEKFVLVHSVHEGEYAQHHHPAVGILSAAAMIGHSFMDGISIGLAFQVSQATGITVAIAVIAHDFCDGLNTMSVMLLHGNRTPRASAMLALDAIAPILGALSTLAFSVPPEVLVLYLGFFAGFLLYIGASDILPQAHSRAGSAAALNLIGLTVLGATSMYLVMRVTA